MEAALDRGARFTVDDLLNFTLDAGDENDRTALGPPPPPSLEDYSSDPHTQHQHHQSLLALPDFAEEELPWLSNKDAFPSVETCLDILPGAVLNHQSPVSVLENSASNSNSNSTTAAAAAITSCCGGGRIAVPVIYPMKARSNRRRRRRGGFPCFSGQQSWSCGQENAKQESPLPRTAALGRRCYHCLAEKTPQWRTGPLGPKTLCNACGVRFKSGRLVPEYRPASSPTFSNLLHSNSHRKVVEMRRQKQLAGLPVNEACEYRVG
ncbi:GATA transcription factor 1 [Diospyros lotus]|uniref:GATA transcription factor 1 n=1 Tax=Diospyros lotus TaxID=55363 RepID=UPI002255EF9E|nr:GATA transcription factor 1 [Diospyros lotus]XP_052191283.1 GATA transcription factor 1 [Diospyros lotus]